MEIIAWIISVLFALLILYGMFKGIIYLFYLQGTEGTSTAVFVGVLAVLFCGPALTEEFAPQFHDLSKIALMLYVIGFLVYRFALKRGGSN